MADVTVTPARGTYKKDATAAYWGAGNRIIVKGGTAVEIWDETNVVPYTIKIIGESGVEAERIVAATGSWYTDLGKDAEVQIDIKRSAAGAAFSVAFLVT